MRPPTPPDKKSSLVAGFVLNTLAADEAEAFAQMVADDPTLLDEVERLQQSLESAFEIEEVSPPPLLRDRLLSALPDQLAEQPTNLESLTEQRSLSPASPTRHASNRSVGLWKAAAATFAIALTLSNFLWWQSSRQQIAKAPDTTDTQPVSRNETQTYQLEITENGISGTAEIVIDPETMTATLNVSALPLIASDQTYVLWTVLDADAPYTKDAKSAVLTTTFGVDAEGNSQKTLTLPIAFQQPESVAAIAITVESADAPQDHENKPVLIKPLES